MREESRGIVQEYAPFVFGGVMLIAAFAFAGNYMGQNFGLVTGISGSQIQLRELIQDAAGDWSERQSTLQLQEVGSR